MRNVLLTIAYDGTDYAGWQRQPGVKTVQGELERALSVVCAETVTIDGTSRTDAGVHAL
ncbi:MAG: tRNA pseudouridine(38-40) synthase TruA, partial [Firmicutes bacterium]|nr:tRNA pseudouridine(38-40) synthase TruA [Bacillota bacterium]